MNDIIAMIVVLLWLICINKNLRDLEQIKHQNPILEGK